jgi:Methylase involved in ubiquinone/menaquinone biosynthesis
MMIRVTFIVQQLLLFVLVLIVVVPLVAAGGRTMWYPSSSSCAAGSTSTSSTTSSRSGRTTTAFVASSSLDPSTIIATRATTATTTTAATASRSLSCSFPVVNNHKLDGSRYNTAGRGLLLLKLFSTSNNNNSPHSTSTATATAATSTIPPNKAKPRTGLSQQLLDWALASPFWKLVLVPQARRNIVQTAEANGIAWKKSYDWLLNQPGPWNKNNKEDNDDDGSSNGSGTTMNQDEMMDATATTMLHYPSYYTKEFHAYPKGNLSWEAAIEQELASRAVGARNFPAHGAKGEDVFRSSFEEAILRLGGVVPKGGIVVDFGCGTGTSTRRLSKLFPQADKFVGMDLSPFFIAVGQRLLELAPTKEQWVTNIEKDERIELRVGNVADTNLDNESVDAVNLSLVIHEMPIDVTLKVCQEAYRILKPGGQLYISEMDFDSPAYAAQRENAMLFSLLRSTEPYLDEYADGVDQVREYLAKTFQSVKITAATGRHFALVATKGAKVSEGSSSRSSGLVEDTRFDSQGNYAVMDTHLKVWESKKE